MQHIYYILHTVVDMIDKNLLNRIQKLDKLSLYELDDHIHTLIGKRVTYIQRPSLCGQPHCKKCRVETKGHGLYWYAKFTYKGHQHMVYVGKKKKEVDPVAIMKKKQMSNKPNPKKGGK